METNPPQSQKEYEETAYKDASWELVGEARSNDAFEPMRFEVARTAGVIVDPMFEDLGGVGDPKVKRRWHLPENEGYAPEELEEQKRRDEERREAQRVAELEEVKAEAYARGREQAFIEAVEENSQRMAELEQRFAQMFQDLTRQLEESNSMVERNAIDLSLRVAEKIIGSSVEINPEYLVPVLNEAIALAGSALIRRIRVSPQDLEFVNVVGIAKHVKDFSPAWEFVGDDTIRAGCVLETSAGEVDYQLDKAWERVRDNVIRATR